MAIAFVQTNTSGTLADTAAVATASISPTAGNFLILALFKDSGITTDVTALTDNGRGNTWTKSYSQTGGTHAIDLWTSQVVTGGAGTVSWTYSQTTGTRCVWVVQEFSGIATSSPFDASSTILQSAANVNTLTTNNTGTPAQADELVVGAFAHNSTATLTPTAGSGYSNVGNNGAAASNAVWGVLESKIISAATAQNAAVTLSATVGASKVITGCCATFKAAASTFTGRPRPQVPMLRM